MPSNARRRSAFLALARAWWPTVALVAVVGAAVLIVTLGLRASPASPARPIVVSSSAWAPYVGPDLPDGGPVTSLMTEVLSRAGYRPEVQFTSWSLVEQRVTSGVSAGAFPLVASADRASRFLYSEPLVEFDYVLFYNTRRGTPVIEHPEDFDELRVGAVSGYDYWDEITDAVDDRWIEYGTALEGFEALAAGEIDLLAEGLVSGQAVLTSPEFTGDASDFDHVRGEGPLVHSVQGVHFMTARTDESAELVEAFDAALAELRSTGEYDELVGGLAAPADQLVELVPFGDSGLVELLRADGEVMLLAPRGTRATVITWPDELTTSVDGPGTPLVEVKITNGPATGRVAHVDARAVVLEGAGS